jgi:effector-binding domain-containing protein
MKKITTTLALMLLVTFTLTTLKSHAMERKKVEKITVIKYTLETKMSTMLTDVGTNANDIAVKAKELGLEITGPQIWQYAGSDGKDDTPFTLDICLPIKEAKGDPGKFSFDVLPEYNCVSEIHKGPWNKLSNTYEKMMGEMTRKSIIPKWTCREVYITCDFENQENCITEVQMETY